ncbi:MAG TPA: TrmH family RNA methyltransferase [Xanthomonadaceae bacterium]|jgi:TrmH RNA methyltransferase|nr:TrmH family RNA methyltransferase [Xanthomonadaceae bacterium]
MRSNDAHRGGSTPHPPRTRREAEIRLYGVNACRAAFAHRPNDLRKVWLTEANIPAFKPVLAWCVQHRIGYRVVEDDEIERLTESSHHEGVCLAMLRREPPSLDDTLAGIDADAPALLLWLHGVGNPHNLGAILRSAAHFGVRAALLSDATALSPAAWRVAEGGAETVPCVQAANVEQTRTKLHRAGFRLAATVVRDGHSLYEASLPSRLALLLGAEGTGLPQSLTDRADVRLRIPGTGAVESLNVSVASALLIAEWARVHKTDA